MTDGKTETAIVKRENDSLLANPKDLRVLAQDFLNSKMFPNASTVPGIITIIQAGFELGIPPVAALNVMSVINGRLALEAKALLAIAQKKVGVSWVVTKESDDECEIIFKRPGFSDCTVSFTIKEAQAAGLMTKNNWKTYRRDMLFARCASRGIRRIAPDAVLGMYSREEMLDVQPTKPEKTIDKTPPSEAKTPTPAIDTGGQDFFGETVSQQQVSSEKGHAGEPSETGKGGFWTEDEIMEGIVVDDKPDQGPKEEDFFKPLPSGQGELIPGNLRSSLVDAIKEGLRLGKIDEKEYKAWLYEHQRTMKPPRIFIGMKFNNPSLNEGEVADLKWLHSNLSLSIKKYQAWKKGQEKEK